MRQEVEEEKIQNEAVEQGEITTHKIDSTKEDCNDAAICRNCKNYMHSAFFCGIGKCLKLWSKLPGGQIFDTREYNTCKHFEPGEQWKELWATGFKDYKKMENKLKEEGTIFLENFYIDAEDIDFITIENQFFVEAVGNEEPTDLTPKRRYVIPLQSIKYIEYPLNGVK